MKDVTERSGVRPAGLGNYRRQLERAADAAFAARQYDAARALTSVRRCGADITVWQMADGSFDYTPAYCEKKLCRFCAGIWSARLQDRALAVARSIPPRELRHVTFTIANPPAGRLEQDFHGLKTAFRNWRQYGRKRRGPGYWIPVQGFMHKLEIHLSERGDWHPHFHSLIHVPNGIDFEKGSPARESWVRYCSIHGVRASFRDGTFIKRPRDVDGVTREVVKYAAKPVSLEKLAAHPRGDHYLRELAQTLHGARWHSSSGTLTLGNAKPEPEKGRTYLGSARGLLAQASIRSGRVLPSKSALDRAQAIRADLRALDTGDPENRLSEAAGSILEAKLDRL